MAILKPDNTYQFTIDGKTHTVNVKITPDGARATKNVCSYIKKGDYVKPNAKLSAGTGKVKGITIHNTNFINTSKETNPAEQYARATYPNQNMGGIAVHYWVYKNVIWQQLKDNEQGWHAGDGSTRTISQRSGEKIGGNLDTISIEVIETGSDSLTEDTASRLTAYLLHKHNLNPKTDIYTHSYFAKKNCPAYILPHWEKFKSECEKYHKILKSGDSGTMKTHTVKKGESLWSIAEDYYGVGEKYIDIMEYNALQSETVHTGQILKIPTTTETLDNLLKTALKDIKSLSSVKKLLDLVGD